MSGSFASQFEDDFGPASTKDGMNLNVGRHGEMSIPSGQRRKIKKYKRRK